jgi:hypothetical protein
MMTSYQKLAALVYSVLWAFNKVEIDFAGHTWHVNRALSSKTLPGPNLWSPSNVWVDVHGSLHLKVAQHDKQWYSSQVCTNDLMHFGDYAFFVEGPLDKFDPQHVLGLFTWIANSSSEIDIEVASWGWGKEAPNLFYTMWPATNPQMRQVKGYNLNLNGGNESLYTWSWKPSEVVFENFVGFNSSNKPFANVTFTETREVPKLIVQDLSMVCINMWLNLGNVPNYGQGMEIVIHDFQYKVHSSMNKSLNTNDNEFESKSKRNLTTQTLKYHGDYTDLLRDVLKLEKVSSRILPDTSIEHVKQLVDVYWRQILETNEDVNSLRAMLNNSNTFATVDFGIRKYTQTYDTWPDPLNISDPMDMESKSGKATLDFIWLMTLFMLTLVIVV